MRFARDRHSARIKLKMDALAGLVANENEMCDGAVEDAASDGAAPLADARDAGGHFQAGEHCLSSDEITEDLSARV